MLRLGLRLAVAGGREAIARLALIAIAVAIGVTLLLTTFSAVNALSAQNDRYSWLMTGYPATDAPVVTHVDPSSKVDPLWWKLREDYFQGSIIGRVDVAATGPGSPVPPGIPALPAAGEFYASPAMAKLLRTTPADQLGNRYPGKQVGVVGPEALPAPDTLLIVVGRDPVELALEGGDQVAAISTTSPAECTSGCIAVLGTDSNGMTVVLSVVAAALLFPVLIFIGGATRLSAARREQRFAAMRLVGATPRQVAQLATVESTVAATLGVLLGFGLFFLLRPAIAHIPFTGEGLFPGDLSLTLKNVLVVGLGVPLAAAIVARLALRRVVISPLGVSRRVTPPPPRAWRLIPGAAGIAWLAYLAYFSDIGTSKNSNMQAYAYLLGVFLVMIGLVMAGPRLTMIGARVTAKRTNRATGLIASRRLSDNPQSAFRAISGVVLAVFIASAAIGTITTIVAYHNGSASAADGAASARWAPPTTKRHRSRTARSTTSQPSAACRARPSSGVGR